MSHFIVRIKDDCGIEYNNIVTFNEKCNAVDYSDKNFCVFKRQFDDDQFLVLGMFPYENICWILNVEDNNE